MLESPRIMLFINHHLFIRTFSPISKVWEKLEALAGGPRVDNKGRSRNTIEESSSSSSSLEVKSFIYHKETEEDLWRRRKLFSKLSSQFVGTVLTELAQSRWRQHLAKFGIFFCRGFLFNLSHFLISIQSEHQGPVPSAFVRKWSPCFCSGSYHPSCTPASFWSW